MINQEIIMTINVLPAVGRIQGASGPNQYSGQSDMMQIQYTDHSGSWHQIDMNMGDAMYLLCLLRSIQLDCGIDLPDDPRGISQDN